MADKDFVVKNGLVVNNYAFSVNATGIYFGNNLHANSSVVNGTATSANNATYLGGTHYSLYQLTSGMSAYQTVAGMSSYQTVSGMSSYQLKSELNSNVGSLGYMNTSASYTITGVHTHNANLTISTTAGVIANGSVGSNGQALISNGSTVYWGNVATSGGATGNESTTDLVFFVGGQTVNGDFTTLATKNYLSAGPITVNQPATISVTAGSRWTIV